MKQTKWLAMLALLAASLAARADTTSNVAPCTGIQDVKSKSRQHQEMSFLMVALASLEGQGEANFHPTAAVPKSECVFATFEVAGNPVTAIYSPFEKIELLEQGARTRNWQFNAGGAEPRTILVLFDAMSSLTYEKDVLLLVEERKETIFFYGLFRDPPSFAALKPMVTGILDGSLRPIVGMRWPPGAKEALVDGYDTKRLH